MAKILVVEDDQLLSQLIRDYLTGERHDAETAFNGQEALDMLQISQFDLILLDWELPHFTGVKILKQFRSKGGATPVLMMTKRGSINEKETGFNAGTDDYLTKPF